MSLPLRDRFLREPPCLLLLPWLSHLPLLPRTPPLPPRLLPCSSAPGGAAAPPPPSGGAPPLSHFLPRPGPLPLRELPLPLLEWLLPGAGRIARTSLRRRMLPSSGLPRIWRICACDKFGPKPAGWYVSMW